MIRFLIPYLQLAFVGWVVWSADVPQWQRVASILLLAWLAVGIVALRVAFLAISRAFLAHDETLQLTQRQMSRTWRRPR